MGISCSRPHRHLINFLFLIKSIGNIVIMLVSYEYMGPPLSLCDHIVMATGHSKATAGCWYVQHVSSRRWAPLLPAKKIITCPIFHTCFLGKAQLSFWLLIPTFLMLNACGCLFSVFLIFGGASQNLYDQVSSIRLKRL